MHNNFLTYWRTNYRTLIPVGLIFITALSLPPFRLFVAHSAGMLQSHLLMELFSVIVASLIAIISWHDLKNASNPKSGILLAGFSIVAVMDLVHALTYDGMPSLITATSTHRAIFFWLAGRTFVAFTLLLLVLPVRPLLSR